MKYTQEQKDKLAKKGKDKFRVQFDIENRVKNEFPITVTLEYGYYIIESKMNKL